MCRPGGDGFNELIVVTVLVAAQTGLKLPKIRNREELTEALNALGGLAADQVIIGFVRFLCYSLGLVFLRS